MCTGDGTGASQACPARRNVSIRIGVLRARAVRVGDMRVSRVVVVVGVALGLGLAVGITRWPFGASDKPDRAALAVGAVTDAYSHRHGGDIQMMRCDPDARTANSFDCDVFGPSAAGPRLRARYRAVVSSGGSVVVTTQ